LGSEGDCCEGGVAGAGWLLDLEVALRCEVVMMIG